MANSRRLSRVAVTNEQIVDDSLASQFNDFEDAMQYYTVLKAIRDATTFIEWIIVFYVESQHIKLKDK